MPTRLRELCDAYDQVIADTNNNYPLVAQIDMGTVVGPKSFRYNGTTQHFMEFNEIGWVQGGIYFQRPGVVASWHDNYDVKIFSVSSNRHIAFTPKVYFDSAQDGTELYARGTRIESDTPPFQ